MPDWPSIVRDLRDRRELETADQLEKADAKRFQLFLITLWTAGCVSVGMGAIFLADYIRWGEVPPASDAGGKLLYLLVALVLGVAWLWVIVAGFQWRQRDN